MYVRKFESESMEEALKAIKMELGPDAIILKTKTNKGLKGAFSKNKIEITAAISEKSYTKKARVDQSIEGESKEQFYNSPSEYISDAITDHNSHLVSEKRISDESSRKSLGNSYGNLGINRAVKKVGEKISSGLDDFLNMGSDDKIEEVPVQEIERAIPAPSVEQFQTTPDFSGAEFNEAPAEDIPVMRESAPREASPAYGSKIDLLEKKILELNSIVSRIEKKVPAGIFSLRSMLGSFDVSQKYIQKLVQRAVFELSEGDLENEEVVFEFALRDMQDVIKTKMPAFSETRETSEGNLTILISETSNGQSCLVKKVGALKDDAVIIRLLDEKQNHFSEDFFERDVQFAKNFPELMSLARKAFEDGRTVFVDLKCLRDGENETRRYIEGFKRGFGHVEVVLSLSAIHSQLYNMKLLNKYRDVVDGLAISKLDLCLSFGEIFNIAEASQSTPMIFFGTGEIIPDDIEAATAERILDGIFNFK